MQRTADLAEYRSWSESLRRLGGEALRGIAVGQRSKAASSAIQPARSERMGTNVTDDNDELLRAYASLVAFKGNLADEPVREDFAGEYHALLVRIGNQIGRNLDEFQIPDGWYFQYAASHSERGGTEYRPGRFVRMHRFRTKFDAAMNYINLLMPEDPKRRMGF